MDKYTISSDGSKIHYTETTQHPTTLVFVHGWLGNTHWWDAQKAYFETKYNIVQIDLGGHGQSDKSRQNWTSEQYADDIKAVVKQLDSSEIILIGHSMAGAYVLEASLDFPQVKAIILVDTLKDLDEDFTPEQAEEYMFSNYRKDFQFAIENIMPQYLFVEKTPENIKKQLQSEFLQNTPDLAINTLRPLYEMDIRTLAKQVDIPVRAINSDASPTALENNRKHIKNYDYKVITATGHYPMLEDPTTFNEILRQTLSEL